MKRVEITLPADLAGELAVLVAERRAALPPGAVYLAGTPLVDLYREHLQAARVSRNAAAARLASRYEKGQRPATRSEGETEILTTLILTTDPQTRGRLKTLLVEVGGWTRQIRALARRWRCEGVDQEEFEGAGLQGLLEAADRFDGRPSGWPTFATSWIRRRVQELARLQGGPLVAITHHEERRARLAGASRRAAGWAPLDPSNDEENSHAGEVGAAVTSMQDAKTLEGEELAQRSRLAVMIKKLPPELRRALTPELKGKSGKVDPALRARALASLRDLMSESDLFGIAPPPR